MAVMRTIESRKFLTSEGILEMKFYVESASSSRSTNYPALQLLIV
jgi:hypothetical protein